MIVSKIFGIFIPIWGNGVHFDEHIFQVGWFNHHLDTYFVVKNGPNVISDFLNVKADCFESPGCQKLFMGDSASLSPSCSSHPGNTGVWAVENKETKRLYLTRSSSDL